MFAADCPQPHDGISVVKVPIKDPAAARVVAKPRVSKGGCHDITVSLPKTPAERADADGRRN